MTVDFMEPIEEKLEHPIHEAAYAYWLSLRARAQSLPARSHIDPADIPRLLPWINLIEVHREASGLRYRHRLVGTGIVDMRQRDGTGRWFDDLYDQATIRKLRGTLDPVVADGHPRILRGNLGITGKGFLDYQSLLLPLAEDGRRVDMLMGVSVYD
ncbi:MAG: PAS domain-containing protein [Alphaproteobacteria bacterium]|nr:PAS domain-containing protein [Alphaproteobacteria bacterium]